MATRLISGVLREVWQEAVPLAGGASQAISTGIRVGPQHLPRILATVYVSAAAGAPEITAAVAVVAGFAVVTLNNIAPVGNTATFVLDIMRIHSAQQAREAANGIVHVVYIRVGGTGTIGLQYPFTDVNIANYPVVDADVWLAVRRTSTGTCTIALPAIATTPIGRVLIVTDTGRSAALNNIIMVPVGADTINGAAANYIIDVSASCFWFAANHVTNNWELI